jgi:hypothetical protein
MGTDAEPMAEHVQRWWRDGQAPDGDVIVFGTAVSTNHLATSKECAAAVNRVYLPMAE